jgi:hypothetical protein
MTIGNPVGAADQIVDPNGTRLTPRQIIQHYFPEDWELFVREWMDGFNPPYHFKDKLGGAGDMGRDVVGYDGEPSSCGPWDNYQCKHYKQPLSPTDIYTELGKLCVFTFQKKYTVPRRYRFVAPLGVGPKLFRYLENPELLRAELIANWPAYCETKISDSESFPLTGDLKRYVESFDFSIVGYIPVDDILEQHCRTAHWSRRFQIEAPQRPENSPPPAGVQPAEAVYLKRLFEAYSDHLESAVNVVSDLQARKDLQDHYHLTREFFYSAEMLGRFSRDNFTPGAFEKVKTQVYHGVADVTRGDHSDGYKCLVATTQRSLDVPIGNTPLKPYLEPSDLQGVCHHLANDGKLRWVK